MICRARELGRFFFVCLFVCLVFHFIGILRRRAAFFTALISRLGAGWPGQATADLFKVRHSMAAHKKNAHEEARPALTHTHTQRERERERHMGCRKRFQVDCRCRWRRRRRPRRRRVKKKSQRRRSTSFSFFVSGLGLRNEYQIKKNRSIPSRRALGTALAGL